jgi:hypothetical protein
VSLHDWSTAGPHVQLGLSRATVCTRSRAAKAAGYTD